VDHIDIPEGQVVPLDAVAPGVHGLRITFVNVFGINHRDGSWTLIDSALPFSQSLIRRWAEKHFDGPPNAIILSHGHFDHVGSAQALADEWGVEIYADPLEHPYLTGKQEYPAPNPGAGGGMMSLLSPLLPRGPVNLGDRLRALPKGEEHISSLALLPDWQIVLTPGHTPGHVSFFRPADRTLLPADAFCTTKPESFFQAAIAQAPELHGPPSYFTWNWDLARQSVERLAVLEPSVVAPGHGKPLVGDDVALALRQLSARFDEVAVPDNRKDSAA
jgi:glyoxylase-like metal-dependent hydrolase (beta-lactamase superfamily II)